MRSGQAAQANEYKRDRSYFATQHYVKPWRNNYKKTLWWKWFWSPQKVSLLRLLWLILRRECLAFNGSRDRDSLRTLYSLRNVIKIYDIFGTVSRIAGEAFLFGSIENLGWRRTKCHVFVWFIKFASKEISRELKHINSPPPQPPDRLFSCARIVRCWNIAKIVFLAPRSDMPAMSGWVEILFACGKLKIVSFLCQFSVNLELRLQFSCNFSISAC